MTLSLVLSLRGMIVDVVDVDVEMQRLDRRSGGENFETFEQIFPMSIELCLVRFRVFFTRAEMQGADIWEDAFGWCPRTLEKRVRLGKLGPPQLNFSP